MRLRAAEKWRFNRRTSGKYISVISAGTIGSLEPRNAERSASERGSDVPERNAAQSRRLNFMYADNSSEWVILIRSLQGLIRSSLARQVRTRQGSRRLLWQ